jgi:pimeloyl-ACP methyl ester carboxylesterase
VPLDYAAPSGETLRLALKRLRASGMRTGSLLINPGGPGASAIDFLNSFATRASAALRERFDIVAFDPRGVGASAPLDCHSSLQKLIAADPSPDSDAEWAAIDAAAETFAAECARKHAALLPHMSTRDVARDMDLVRAALGEEQLNYLGFSYGTELGARYAELFPQRVRRFVLDGALDLKLSSLEIALQQAQGFEQALGTYFSWCASAASNCTWAASATPASAFSQLSTAVDKQPIAAARADRALGPGEFMLGVIAPLYGGSAGYRTLSTALRAAAGGDGAALLSLTDQYLQRRQDGAYGNIQEANNAVNCLDLPVPAADEVRAQAPRFTAAAPNFGLSTLTGLLVCAHWPVHGTQYPPPTAAGAAPILVIGTTGDPATPYAWAQALAAELESGVLLTYEGEGHTAYGRGVPCIDSAVEAYFINGKVPAKDTRCARAQAQASMIEPGPMSGRAR